MSGSKSDSVSTGGGYPPWTEQFFKSLVPKGDSAVSAFDPSGGALRTASDNQLLKILNPNYLDHKTDPYLQMNADAIQRGGEDAFNRFDNQLAAGQQRSGSLYSTSGQRVRSDMARNVSGDITDRLSALYGDFYRTGRAQQQAAIQPAAYQSQYDFNLAQQIANIFKGLPKSKSKAENASGGI